MVIGIIGQRLSGKDTAAEYLVKKYGAYHMKYSMILDEILNILDQPISRRNEIDLGMALRKVFKENVLSSAITKKALSNSQDLKVVSGIRFEDEYQTVKSLGAKFIYVTAPDEVLYQRFLKRNQKADDSKLTEAEFIALEKEPTEVKISELGQRAEYKIVNTGSFEDFYNQIEEVITKLKE